MTMLKRLYIHNFKCLENFELPLPEHSSSLLLIGKNGAGKSTIRRALEILQSIARGDNRVAKLISRADFAIGRVSVPIRFEIEVVLGSAVYAYQIAFELPASGKELRVAEERFSVDSAVVFSRERAQVSLPGGEGRFQVDWHLAALPLIQESSSVDPLFIFKNWLARMLVLAPVPRYISGVSEGDTLLPNSEVTNFSEWFAGILALSPSAYAKIDGYLRGVLPDLSEIKNPIIGAETRRLTVHFRENAASLEVPFEALSDGEKCFFICALTIAANSVYGPLLCFWDEPDDHLMLSEVGHFIIALRRAFQDSGQFIATSHREETIRHFSSENTLYLYRRSHFEPTQIRPVSELQFNGGLIDAMIRDDVEP